MVTTIFDETFLLSSAQSNKSFKATIVNHPLVRDKLGELRNEKTPPEEFREYIECISIPLLLQSTKDLIEKEVIVTTPLNVKVSTRKIASKIILIPVLRSGLGMINAANKLIPHARTVHVGLERDEKTAQAHWYLDLRELKDLDGGVGAVFIVLDPMLATGGSGAETISRIKEVYPKAIIKFVGILAAPEGIKEINARHPDVEITVAAVDDHLNDIKYIVPGLGDAGDRQFGT